MDKDHITMRTPEQFCKEMKIIHPDIEVVGTYTKAIDPIRVKCLVCGKEWNPKAYSLISGKGCPHCSAIRGAKNNTGKTGLKNGNTFIKQIQKINPNVKVLSEYKTTHTDVKCECLVCGNKWITKPYSLLQGHGCPRCAKSGTSFMEQFIYHAFCTILGEEKVLSRDRKTIGMELDIVIPEYKIAIEPGNWFLHKRALDRDSKKRERCQNVRYRLITIYDNCPEKKPPFDHDCCVYQEDLNKADHSIIRKLVIDIVKSMGIKLDETTIAWADLEKVAYDNAKAKTHKDFIVEMKTKMPSIEVMGKYVSANRRIRVKCRNCGFEWDAIPANIIRGDGCRKCGAKSRGEKSRKNQEDFEKELKRLIPTLKVVGKYIGRHKQIRVQCAVCGTVWETTPGSLLRKDHGRKNNSGCPVCARQKKGYPRKSVINIDTGEIFESATKAGEKYNTVPSAIRQCCRGASNTSKGYHWKYIEE